MIIENRTLENGAIIAIWEITEDIDELLGIINFNPFVIEQIYNFGSDKRKLEYLAVRALVHEICGENANIEYNTDGSPFLTGANFNISITHTGKYAAIIIHPNRKVGIDIERQSDRVMRVKHKFLNEKELQYIDSRSEKTHLTILWAAKEALYKIIGVKIVEFTEQIIVDKFQPYLHGEITANETCSSMHNSYELEYQVTPEYVMAWTVK